MGKFSEAVNIKCPKGKGMIIRNPLAIDLQK